ncbi:YhjD/YihY/BrkB family envelope integrity protein [Aeromicrobium massiliense]|uniref:YhjD/YihY/BrkB family envelope integrity protein n=1 Tax=Aeromicrobium massiliense TaxID=1464554 RepID=UPI0002EA803E|nr:YhjD/YihY/BrkB family envelope integrity protein [Aeromicrobium massiliense]
MSVVARAREHASAVRVRGQALGERVLASVPLARRVLRDLVRVEFVDRAIVVAAQALLALVPLIVVLAAFLPDEARQVAADRMQAVTGLEAGREAVASTGAFVQDPGRAQLGTVGALITVLSASSFARALMRAYEVVWELPHVAGLRGRRRCLGWLLGWLVALEALAATRGLRDVVDGSAGELALRPVVIAGQVVLVCALWWWTLHVLLAGRVGWRPLVVPAVVTGVAVMATAAGSSVVMPRYAASSVEQFGGFGLVLALAAWLVAVSGVLVVGAIVGRAVAEDPTCARWWHRVTELGHRARQVARR